MKLYVDTEDHGTVCVKVKGSDRIEDVWDKIWERTGGYWYRLVYNSTLLPHDHTVSQCGLYDGCSVKGRRVWWITVVTDCGEEIRLCVWRAATVGEVKGMVEKEKGIPAAHQVLKYKGKELRDESTMEGCGVWDSRDRKLQVVTRESSRYSTSHAQLEQRVSAVEETVREKHQEFEQRCGQLSENEQQLVRRVAELEEKLASLHAKESNNAKQKGRSSETIEQKFTNNFESFLDTDLDVADRLYSKQVINKDKFFNIFDKNSTMTRREKVRGMLMEVMKSEKNIRTFRQALLDQGDVRSRELAKLLD